MKFISVILSLYLGISLSFGTTPRQALDSFLADSGVDKSSVAVCITSLEGEEILATHNSSAPLIPASIMKSVTIAALLDNAGLDFRFITPVFTDGENSNGILHGNLIIEGNGDPSLHSGEQPGSSDFIQEIATALKKEGISAIEGKIIIDRGLFSGPSRPASWMAADFAHSYGTGFHALNFEDNAKGKDSVENPATSFLSKLQAKLRQEGISVEDKKIKSGVRNKLFQHSSAPIDEIMRSCMMRSDNLYAESFLRTFGKLNGGNGSVDDSAKKEKAMWKSREMPLQNVTIIDGSGLSRANRVTADFMTSVLSSMSGNAYYASFFPLAGQDGTLASFLKDSELDSYVALKTGSMKGIQCYAGYKLDDEYNPTHTIVIIMNNINGNRKKAKEAAEKLLLDTFSHQPLNGTNQYSQNE